ncbi:hypothetical protein [Streptomyces spirodelae]|uniref:Transmembrane protein n=1 Tax=Streptomyces spirodelae TaxID=2812904 RepID=A0ABS3WW13_9ACTN|nr:hypothetical protein [Streptomyces spirodelae]MBO8187316.1 hypothetical protein [Streptomyces spirodelae]
MAALSAPAAFLAVLVVMLAKNAEKLLTGESATVRGVSRCVEGGGMALPASHCDGRWAFSDGRTGEGEITGSEVSVGDSIFAGDGWAYTTTGPLHRIVWALVGILVALAVVLLSMYVGYRRRLRRTAAEG